MEKILELLLHESGELLPVNDGASLGLQLENGATSIQVDLPKSSYGNSHYLEFVKPDGTALSTSALEEKTSDSGVHYIKLPVSSYLNDQTGRVLMQYVGRGGSDLTVIKKSSVVPLDVDSSINASNVISLSDPDFISWATHQIALLTEKVGGLDEDTTNDPATKEELSAETERAKSAETLISKSVSDEKTRAEASEKNNSDAISNESTRAKAAETQLGSRILTLEQLVNGNTFFMGAKFYGSETVGERLGAAVGLRAGVNGAVNDFDSMPIYNNIKKTTETSGNVMVKVGTPFFCKRFSNGNPGDADFWYADCISPYKIDDSWGLHYAFINADGTNRGYFTISSYFASREANKLVSKTGTIPLTNMTPKDARVFASAGNVHLAENRKLDAMALLFEIEFATTDGQSVFKGITSYNGICPSDNANIQLADNGTTIVWPVADLFSGSEDEWGKAFKVGSIVNVWDDNNGGVIGENVRTVTAISFVDGTGSDGAQQRQVHITVSGSGFPLKTQDEIYADLQNFNVQSGQCDALTGSSGEITYVYDGVRGFSYRGIENLWGLWWCFGEGTCIVCHHGPEASKWVRRFECFDPAAYTELNEVFNGNSVRVATRCPSFVNVGDYPKTGYSGFIKKFKDSPSEGYFGVDIPEGTSTNGSSATFRCDVCYANAAVTQTTEQEILYLIYRGGLFGDGVFAGPWYAGGSWNPSTCDGSAGFRLSSDPS